MEQLKALFYRIAYLLFICLFTLPAFAEKTQCVNGSAGPLATIALLSKKSTVSDADFFSYWRDIHGMLATRIPGFWTYRQYHLGKELVDFRRLPSGYKHTVETFQGLADVSFCDEQSMAALAVSPQSELIKQDEKNAFSSTYLYAVQGGDSLTLKRHLPLADLANNDTDGSLIMLLAKAPNEQFSRFRGRIDSLLLALPTQCSTLQRLRVNFFQGFDANAWPAPEVNHQPQQVFNAAIEFQFSQAKAAVDCLSSHAVFGKPNKNTITTFQQVYGVNQRFAMVVDGNISPVGLRGLPAIELINRLGAQNQVSDSVLKVVYGDLVR